MLLTEAKMNDFKDYPFEDNHGVFATPEEEEAFWASESYMPEEPVDEGSNNG